MTTIKLRTAPEGARPPVDLKPETVDVTPTWRGILPVLLTIYADGTFQGRKEALAELQRMADLADLYVAEHKGKGE